MKKSIEESLSNLGLDYVDQVSSTPACVVKERSAYMKRQYLIHFPQVLAVKDLSGDDYIKNEDGTLKALDSPTFVEVWAEMEQVLKKGKAKSIGVSNFSVKKYDSISSALSSSNTQINNFLKSRDTFEDRQGRPFQQPSRVRRPQRIASRLRLR